MGPAGKQLTDQQRAAIETRDVSVALSAGAGCGKTFVLVERFLSHVDPSAKARAELSELIAITFTERAAREMRKRLRDDCHQRLRNADDAEVAPWLELVRQLDAARISTIHAFCGTLLRAHAVEAGVDPRFQVLDAGQAATLLAETIDDELRRQLAAERPETLDLVVMFGLESLRTLAAGLLDGARGRDIAAWLAATPEDLLRRWQSFHAEHVRPQVLRRIAESDPARIVLRLATSVRPRNTQMMERCLALREALPLLESHERPLDLLTQIRADAMVQGGGGKRAWPNNETYEQFRDASGELRVLIDQASELVGFDVDSARASAEAGLKLLAVCAPMAEAYRRRKDELGFLDFDDLLIGARDLLGAPRREALRERIARRLTLLLVDEFQDTDPWQVELVESLCGRDATAGKLFVVGDSKQSIYRFRGADPRVFRALRERMPQSGRLPLTRNFRSQPAILKFVNALFRDALPDYEPLHPSRPQVSPQPAIEFLWATVDEPTEDSAESARAGERRQREADWIARRLRSLVDSGNRIVWDAEAPRDQPAVRPARQGDIALLFRALTDIEHYEAALRRYGFDYYVVGGKAFYSQQEVYDLLNLLRAVASPCDEVSLAGALRSPFFSLADETLYWLALGRGGLNQSLLADSLPPQLDPQQRERARFAARTLSFLRQQKDRLPIAGLVNQALAMTGYDAVLLAEFLGERKLANLRKLVHQARGFDRVGVFSLSDFITQLSQFVAEQPDEALAATHRESSNVVRLMSIHQSKGLEFPIVVVPDLERAERPNADRVVFHPKLGPLVAVRDRDGQSLPGGLQMHRAMETAEDEAEHLRLLYVATTRAADYLLLSAGVKKADEPTSRWRKLLAERFNLLSGKPCDALTDEGDAPPILVTIEEPVVDYEPRAKTRRADLARVVEMAQIQAAAGTARAAPLVAPIAPDVNARRYFSFSRLSGHLEAVSQPVALVGHDAELIEHAEVAGAQRGDPRDVGTLVHEALALLDLKAPGDVRALVERVAARRLGQAGDEVAAAAEMLSRFVASPRARALAESSEVFTETEFLLAWPLDGSALDQEPHRGPILEGAIDCLYRDHRGDWRLVDYKTNQVTTKTIDAVAARYEMQMFLYALAAERILGQPPASLTLHFLRTGAEREFAWNDAARARAVELTGRAMSALAGASSLATPGRQTTKQTLW